jgi:hypothetical protein
VNSSERQERLARARSRGFFFDVDDAAALLCRENVAFGLAKLHWLQELLGWDPDATYISTPDSTVTRNIDRWTSGFGYGGAFEWSGRLMPLELKPNCCGMLAAGLQEIPDLEETNRLVARLAESTLPVDGVAAHWDMHRGNHFINLYRVSDPKVTQGFPFLVVMHSSGSEFRGPNPRGPGLYMNDEGTGLAAMAERLDSPFGPVAFLQGDASDEYVAYVAMVDVFAKARREAYVRSIFGENVRVLFNETHQGLDGAGRMLLGCYSTRSIQSPWVPVTLRPELPAYLVAPGKVYGEEAMDEALRTRAKDQGCLDRLRKADLLPHGGGYAFPEQEGQPIEVVDDGPRRHFRFGSGPLFEHVRDLPFAYRADEVVHRLESLGAGRVVAKLEMVSPLEG